MVTARAERIAELRDLPVRARRTNVQFDRDSPWFRTTREWAIDTLSECALSSSDGAPKSEATSVHPQKKMKKSKSKKKKG